MTTPDELIARNLRFAEDGFRQLSINPSGNMMVIGCVDPRVDPTYLLGLEQGEAAVIRNVGGRVTPATLRTMAMLGKVSQAHLVPGPAQDWNLVILHHTDCGMHAIAAFPELLAEYFEIPEAQVDAKAPTDPVASVRVDVDVILNTLRGARFFVSGLAYDVATGLVETVVPPTALRPPV